GRVGIDADVFDGMQVGDASNAGRVHVVAGVSALSGVGFHPGERPTKDTLIWRDANEDGLVQASELTAVNASAGVPSESFPHSAVGGDARVRVDVPIVGA